jgi:hypothetical protein
VATTTGSPGILGRFGFRQSTVLLVILVATIAFVASVGRSVIQDQQHGVNTTVFVARVLPGSSASDVDASIADFITVIGLPIVRDPVSTQTGVSASKLRDVHVNRIQTSSAVDISYTSSDADLAARVVTAAARQGLRALAQQQVDAATEAANSARAADDAALKAIFDYESSLGVVDLASEYQLRRQDLLNLQAQASTAPSAALTALVKQRAADVDRLAAALPQFNQLSDRLSAARTAVADASKALNAAQGKLSAADSPSALTKPHVVTSGRLLPAIRSGLVAFFTVVTLGLALALLQAARQRRMMTWFSDRLRPFVGQGSGHVASPARRGGPPEGARSGAERTESPDRAD